MVNITMAIPDDLYRKMKLMKEIRWSEVSRVAIEKRIASELMVNEGELQSWAVKLQRLGRKGRFAELKKKGLV
jgi:predicted CopG family antitoxin